MKSKVLNLLLIITSLFGYLEWGKDNSSFLFQAEYEILNNLFNNPKSIIHPFILLPLFGQLLLMITVFQKIPSKILTITGIVCLGLLLGFMFFIGVLGLNLKILISTLPFLSTAIIVISSLKKVK